jgi:hypothetical protein
MDPNEEAYYHYARTLIALLYQDSYELVLIQFPLTTVFRIVCGQSSVFDMAFYGNSVVSFCLEFIRGLTKIRGSDGEPWHVGFVCHHVDVDGVEVLRRAAEARLGGNGKFADLDIIFIDRYDRSGSDSPGCELIV